jgi:predicted porin
MNKKALAVAIAGALAVPTVAQAIDVKLSGQVNRAVMYMDDGTDAEIRHVDNSNSSTRFRFTGSEKLSNGMSAGITWEVQMQSNASAAVKLNDTTDAGGAATFTERKVSLFFSGGWGKVTLGQDDGAGNGTIERDLSGTVVAALASRQTLGGAILYRTSTGASTGVTVGGGYNHYDGRSRYDLIRYDTPTLGPGIVLSASHGTNDVYEFAGSIRTSFAGGKLDAALYYGDYSGRPGGFTAAGASGANIDEQWGGSGSFLFSQGTSITVHYAEANRKQFSAATPASGRDSATWGAKLGHKWGNHAVAIDYSEANDYFGSNFDTETWGVSWVYTIPKPGIELYAVYRNWDLSTPAGVASADDINIVMVGSRIKF